jgi:hypothetical protein
MAGFAHKAVDSRAISGFFHPHVVLADVATIRQAGPNQPGMVIDDQRNGSGIEDRAERKGPGHDFFRSGGFGPDLKDLYSASDKFADQNRPLAGIGITGVEDSIKHRALQGGARFRQSHINFRSWE